MRNIFNKTVILFFLLISIVYLTFSQQPAPKSRFIYGNDGTDILSNELHNSRLISVDDVYDYVDIAANSQVTTYMICSGDLLTFYKSGIERALGHVSEIENNREKGKIGENLLQSDIKVYKDNFDRLDSIAKSDIVRLTIDRAKEKGMEAFITFRMNDLHFNDISLYNPLVQSDFWLNNPELRVGKHPGWHADGALNFARKEVRKYKLDLIEEQCRLFNIDGIELDYMRFPVYFPYNKEKECLDIMTGFISDVKKITKQIGDKRGRPIILAVRVPARMDACLNIGLDVKKWSDLKLIDFITISPFYTGDPVLPIHEFKKNLTNDKIPVYATIESGMYFPRKPLSYGQYRAIAAHCYSEGADGVSLFNYMESINLIDQSPLKNELVSTKKGTSFFNELGNKSTLRRRNKLYSLSNNGINEEFGYRHNTPLPLTIQPSDNAEVKINLPEDFNKNVPKEAILFVRISGNSNFTIKFNGTELKDHKPEAVAQFARNADLETNDAVFAFLVPSEVLRDGNNQIKISSTINSPLVIKRVDVAIKYGDIEEYGYF